MLQYLKAKEDYDLAVKKHALISKRLKKDAQLRHSQMDQMGDNLEAMQKNVQLVRLRKEKLNIRMPWWQEPSFVGSSKTVSRDSSVSWRNRPTSSSSSTRSTPLWEQAMRREAWMQPTF